MIHSCLAFKNSHIKFHMSNLISSGKHSSAEILFVDISHCQRSCCKQILKQQHRRKSTPETGVSRTYGYLCPLKLPAGTNGQSKRMADQKMLVSLYGPALMPYHRRLSSSRRGVITSFGFDGQTMTFLSVRSVVPPARPIMSN